MKLADKFRYLREVEGSLRGLGRAMTQGELLRAIEAETGSSISQSYLSQIESGARPHLTNTTRLLLARFFQVHPGYLVDDPEGYHAELLSDARVLEDKLDLWLISGAERFRHDPELSRALLAVARREDSAQCLLLLRAILEEPRLAERLMEVLRPATDRQALPIKAQAPGRLGRTTLPRTAKLPGARKAATLPGANRAARAKVHTAGPRAEGHADHANHSGTRPSSRVAQDSGGAKGSGRKRRS